MEHTGWISREQHEAIKNLIIMGDERLLLAMDKFKAGDGSELHSLIISGLLNSSTSSMDIVGSLEADFNDIGVVARTCRVCHQSFTINNEKICRFHPESFSGETAQRWLPPGMIFLKVSYSEFAITFSFDVEYS